MVVEALETDKLKNLSTGVRKSFVSRLLHFNYKETAQEVLSQSSEPVFIYELARLRDQPDESAKDWERIRTMLNKKKGEEKEDAIYELADHMEEKGDPKATELWDQASAAVRKEINVGTWQSTFASVIAGH